MLLIGSRAAKYHFPDFRQPKDYDFLGTEKETYQFLLSFNHRIISSKERKIQAKVELEAPTLFEFELVKENNSASDIYNSPYQTEFNDTVLNKKYSVASPNYLFLLKKSHICFNIHWKKSIRDYLFLNSKVNHKQDKIWNSILEKRINETKERIHFKEMNFNMTNSDFFKVSEKFVDRKIPHDNLHYATCFYDKPLFFTVKNDLNKAEMNEDKVNAMPHKLKIKLIQEECMALSLERVVLPAILNNKNYNTRQTYIDMAGRMIYNYLPMYLRFFAADNFLEILDLRKNYVKDFLNSKWAHDFSKFA